MATATQIDRLSRRIDDLEAVVAPRLKCAVVEVPDCLDEEAVLNRHWKLFPADKDAETIVVLRQPYEVDPDRIRYGDSPRVSAAWREIARELRDQQATAE